MDTTKSDNLHLPPDDEPEDRIDPDDQAQEADDNSRAAVDRPATLVQLIMHIDELIADGADPNEGIRKLCDRAIAEPGALIEAASTHVSHLINGGELRKCPDIPPAFLVEELASGATLVSPYIVSHWVDTGDFGRLVQLADCLIKRASSMSGADIGAFILYLANDLAFQEPARSRRLIDIARPLVRQPESDPLVRKATEWQEAGAFLLECDGQLRKFWQTQLTEGAEVSWSEKEAAEAVAHLKKVHAQGKEIPSLLRDAVPPDMRAQASDRSANEDVEADELPSLPKAPEETESLFSETTPLSVWSPTDKVEVIAKSEITEKLSRPPPPLEADESMFLDPLSSSTWHRATEDEAIVGNEGAEQPFPPPTPEGNLSLFPDPAPSSNHPPAVDEAAGRMAESVVQQPAPPPPQAKPVAVQAATAPTGAGEKTKSGLLAGILIGLVTVLAAVAWAWMDAILQATKPKDTASRQIVAPLPMTPDAAAGNPSPPQATPPPQATQPEQPIAHIEKTEAPPSPVPAKPDAHSPPDLPTDAWRKARFAELAQQFPSLVRWHTVARTSKWREARSLIMGTNGAVPSTGEEYPFLIQLLLLDPPLDPEVAEAVPKVAARKTNPAEWIPLFEKLTYPGSTNEKQLRLAAQAYLSASPDFLMPSLLNGLQKLAQPAAKASP